MARELGVQKLEGLVLGNLGDAYRVLGSYGQALLTAMEGVRICRALGHRGGEADALRALGRIYLDLDDRPQARQNLQAALTLDDDTTDTRQLLQQLQD
jgi:tetratricopeptide (TPR) repeat protein